MQIMDSTRAKKRKRRPQCWKDQESLLPSTAATGEERGGHSTLSSHLPPHPGQGQEASLPFLPLGFARAGDQRVLASGEENDGGLPGHPYFCTLTLLRVSLGRQTLLLAVSLDYLHPTSSAACEWRNRNTKYSLRASNQNMKRSVYFRSSVLGISLWSLH